MHDLCSFIVVLTVNMNVHFFFLYFIHLFIFDGDFLAGALGEVSVFCVA